MPRQRLQHAEGEGRASYAAAGKTQCTLRRLEAVNSGIKIRQCAAGIGIRVECCEFLAQDVDKLAGCRPPLGRSGRGPSTLHLLSHRSTKGGYFAPVPSGEVPPVIGLGGHILANNFRGVCDAVHSPPPKTRRSHAAGHIAAARLTNSVSSTVVVSERCFGKASHRASRLALSAVNRSSRSWAFEMRSTRKLRKSFLSSHQAP